MLAHVPIIGIDIWEHAFYLQYKNVKPDVRDPLVLVYETRWLTPVAVLEGHLERDQLQGGGAAVRRGDAPGVGIDSFRCIYSSSQFQTGVAPENKEVVRTPIAGRQTESEPCSAS